jgi:large subunit ribosomal protein L6
MSRIGNNPVNIPEGVSVNFDGNIINVKGKLGEMSQDVNHQFLLILKMI